MFLVACYATLHPALSVRPSIHPSIHPLVLQLHFTFQHLCGFLACRFCSNAPLTSNMVPDHPHMTRVALYLALLVADWLLYKRLCPSISQSVTLCAQVEKTSISCPPVWDWYWLSFLVKTNHFLYIKNERFKKNLLLRLPNACKWFFIPSHCSVYEMPKMVFLNRKNWRF